MGQATGPVTTSQNALAVPAAVPPAIRVPTRAEYAEFDRLLSLASKAQEDRRWDDVERLVRQMMDIDGRTYGLHHPEIATDLGWIASTLMERGRYAEAEPPYRRALKINQAALGPLHPDTADSYNNLAGNLNTQGRYAEAEPLYRKVVEIRETVLGARHPDTAAGYNGVAANLDAQGRYAEAEPFHHNALGVREAVLGARHPDTVVSYNNLAFNLTAQGRYGEAELLYRKALGIRETVLGARHPDTAVSYNNLASNLDAQGRSAEAEPLYRKALEINEAVFGARHPDTALSYNNVAYNLAAQGRYGEAEPLYRKALEINEAVLGARHPRTATAYNNLAYNLDAQGRYAQGEPLYRKALGIRETVLGARNPDTAGSYNNLASNLDYQGRSADAEPLYRKALEINEAVFGARHPNTAGSYNNLASNLDDRGLSAEAEPLFRKALEIREAVLGPRHPSTATSYNNLAGNLNAQGRSAEAEPLYRKALEINEAALGAQHPGTAMNYSNLALSLGILGRYAEAEPLSAKAVSTVRGLRQRERQTLGSGEADGPARSDGLGYVFNVYLRTAAGLASAQPAEFPRLGAASFTAAQDLEQSSAGAALAQAAARVAAGQTGLSETVRRQQDLAVLARGYDAKLLRALGAGDQATATTMRAELERARAELTQLDAEIRAKFPKYAELVSPEALSVGAAQSRLAPGEGLILIVPSGDDVHVFAVSQAKIDWKRVSGGAKGVSEAVTALRCQVDPDTCGAAVPQGLTAFDREKAYGLYRDLIQPVEGALEGVKTLYVTAAGPLSALPLGLLISEAPKPGDNADPGVLTGSAWLADRYALISLPSVSSLRALGALKVASGRLALSGYGDPVLAAYNPAAVRGRGALRVFRSVSDEGLALADPDTLRQGLQSLPGARTELETMARALGAPKTAVHMGAAATETAVKASADLSQARVVLFATHGLLPRQIRGLDEPGLVFTPPTTATVEDDGVLTASEAARLSLTADWVILSACNTASADGTPGAESLSSLAKAFLYAGAHALLASHWQVPDDATAVLTVQTLAIQKANPALTKAQALQAAMKAVRTGTLPNDDRLPGWNPTWSHPTAWAAFALISAGE
jgi:CHAT domain-containing protein/Tfp pilus assembly protein PilF